MKNWVFMLLQNFMLLAMAYFSFTQPIIWVANVFVFISWLVLVLAVVIILSQDKEDFKAEIGVTTKLKSKNYYRVSTTLGAILVCYLASQGQFFYASCWFMLEMAESCMRKILKEKQNATNQLPAQD